MTSNSTSSLPKYQTALVLCLILFVISSTGCTSSMKWRHPAVCPTHLVVLESLSVEELKVRQFSKSWEYNLPPEEVWSTCLDICIQYAGILDTKSSEDGSRSLVVMYPGGRYAAIPMGIGMRELGKNKCSVTVAWLGSSAMATDNHSQASKKEQPRRSDRWDKFRETEAARAVDTFFVQLSEQLAAGSHWQKALLKRSSL